MDVGQQIVIGISIVLAMWFVLASQYNRRRGVNSYRWLRAGLAPLGKISEARWIGTSGSGARLVITNAERPFRRVEIAFLLESRELLPLWLMNRYLRRRHDLMILKADLRTTHTGELEIVRGGPRVPPSPAGEAKRNPWQAVTDPLPGGLRAIERGRDPDRMRAAIQGWLETYSRSVRRLSLARTSPHLILEIHYRTLSG